MKKTEEKPKKSYFETMKELGEKYGVKVTDMSERGVRGIGIVGGVAAKLRKPQNPEPHEQTGSEVEN